MIPLEHHRKAIARRVRELRTERSWTQRELAQRLALSQSRLSEIENGGGSFSAEQLVALLQLFNVSVAELADAKSVPEDQLHNALIRYGADHLLASERVAVNQLPELAILIRDTLVFGEPRQITALAPAIVRNIDVIDLHRVRARFFDVGFEHRLSWLVDNVLIALRTELAKPLAREWKGRYLRAIVVLETFLIAVLARLPASGEPPPPDVLDSGVRSTKTIEELRASASGPSSRWNIITALQPSDFASALAQARPDA